MRASGWHRSAAATCTASPSCPRTSKAACAWTRRPSGWTLTRLAAVDKRLAQVVELRYFAGLSELEIAALLKRSERSIRRDWQKARLFLLASLQDS